MAITKIGRIAASISTRYVGFWPCFQAAPDSLVTLIDRSGKGNHGVAGASGIGASAFSTANTFTSSTAPTTGAALAKAILAAAWRWRASPSVIRDSFIWSAKVTTPNTATTASEDAIMRTGSGAASGGWWLATASNGASGAAPGVRIKVYDTVAGSVAPMGYAPFPANTEATVCFIFDGPGNQVYLGINGALATVSSGTNPAPLTGITGSMEIQVASTLDLYFGGASQGQTDAKKIRGIHMAVVPYEIGPIPDPAALIARLHNHPYTPLASNELP